MRTTVDIAAADIAPSVGSVLAAQSVPESAPPDKRIIDLAHDAIDTLCRLVRPMAIMDEIEKGDFKKALALFDAAQSPVAGVKRAPAPGVVRTTCTGGPWQPWA